MSDNREIAYHASHEQFAPSELLELAVLAEKAGFDAIHSSDHFHPWSERQGQSGFSFAWVAAAMQATFLPFSLVCAPGQRYHPAIVAQAISTLCEMFPSRFTVELGSGEAINEYMSHGYWPPKQVRNARLEQAAQVIRRLLNGEEVSHSGHFEVHEARLYTLPAKPPMLFGAALSEQTAAWCANWADGLLTAVTNAEDAAKKIKAFRTVAGNEKPAFVQYAFSYHKDFNTALTEGHQQWRSNMVGINDLADLHSPKEFDQRTENITMEEFAEKFPVYTSFSSLMDTANSFLSAGANRVIMHNVNRCQKQFISGYQEYKNS
ncbi:TIGR03885 family FMN-dependent LLM class oxidoreductase [Foetidibacter luteolus]|uniref:TIGR03885 family FMN-dependent LLM class oxidoreductase n=1 Tax=Foetidibacter luteolus TaxID=2608880 RepID=UPI00129B8B03|nr:TIGR03885 family FMN-dependent LLM class oxidoreductase [Foetidibacter luteolus]